MYNAYNTSIYTAVDQLHIIMFRMRGKWLTD